MYWTGVYEHLAWRRGADVPALHGAHMTNRWNLLLIGFLLIAAFFLFTEHRAHVLGILPWLLLAACPLLQIFGHRHGGDDHGGTHGKHG